jgi:ParB-like chromosome segregation protein Spo0J
MNEWPADKVERWALDRLIPYARNARNHDEAQVAQLASSIREWGWTVPVLVDENGTIIAGHGRVMAARQLGLAEVPVMIAKGWSEAQCRAYVLADNKLAENAGWDKALLALEVNDLKSLGFQNARMTR